MAERPFIECAEQTLAEQEGRSLQVWLGKPECETLIKVIKSKARSHLAKATNAALQATDEHPLKINEADLHLKAAHFYIAWLSALQEIKDQTTPFTENKWK